ncbi:MAG: PAS domain-containing protein [Janthinobacterium lividum]
MCLDYANSAFVAQVGQPLATLLGHTAGELGQPAGLADPYTAALQRVFATNQPQEHFYDLPTPQRPRHYHARLVPELRDGQLDTVLGIARDITAQHQAAQELQTAKELLQATLDSSLDLVQVFAAVRDEAGDIIDFTWRLNNRVAEESYGNVIGQRLLARNPGVVEIGIFDAFKQVVETGQPNQSERHYTNEQFDGWFYQSTVRLHDGVVTTTNISERKQHEQEVLRLKDELVRQAESK